VLPAAQRHGLGTMIYSPLGGGVLTGKYRRGEDSPADSRLARRGGEMAQRLLTERTHSIVDAVEIAAKELDATPTVVALAWVLSRRGVTSVIIGPRSLAQLEENMPGFDLELPKEIISALNDASRPGGPRA
jgi:aryl-alcohol dehydrogenase-like predicted oxidoreductase